MIFRPEEYDKALAYWKERRFPGITPDQHARILQRGKELIRFHLRHPVPHHLISLGVFMVIFAIDFWVLLGFAAHFSSPVIAGLMVGIAHAYLMYTLAVFTLHEGAAHKLIVIRNGRISRFFFALANNISRITFAETEHYAKNHLSHHAHFTTREDDEFLNFISSRRFFGSFIPFASIFNVSDFKSQSGMRYNASRVLSLVLSVAYHGVFLVLMIQRFSLVSGIIALVLVFPNIAFWLDRTRQYVEHNLMPLSVIDGARDLGVGFWGMLIGGGPWGQPCHWTHHLYPGIPWYQQIVLHNYINAILTPEQKDVFFLKPLRGFPQKLFWIIKETR